MPADRHLLRPSRRELMALGLGTLGLALPGHARAAGAQRKFLFIYADGGWDTTRVFTPMLSTSDDMGDMAQEAEAWGVPFVHSPERPRVTEFMQVWGDRVCVLNGLEVQSITHQRCRQLILTGRSDADADDWAATLAAASATPLLMPHLVLSGPAYTSAWTNRVVRVGNQGQLPALLDGSALATADMPSAEPAGARAVDAWLADRTASWATAEGEAGRAHAAVLGRQYAQALGDLEGLRTHADSLDLASQRADCSRDVQSDLDTVFDCFSRGLSRCAMVRYNGWCDQGWDTHQGPELQSWNFDELFGHLDQMMVKLAERPGEGGGVLADEVVVVVFSEMGRHPRVNPWGGKDHWTWTSAMLLGAGVQGGQAIGGLDEHALGLPVDLDTGARRSDGVSLRPEHLGATLLALGGADVDEDKVIGAALA